MTKIIKQIGQFQDDPADDPKIELEDIAHISRAVIEGVIEIEPGEYVMLNPIDRWESFMDFDRNAVKLGCLTFIRSVMDNEASSFPPALKENGVTHVLVTGNERSRARIPISLKLTRKETQ